MFKYLEIIITSLTTILLAKKLSPVEMGLSMPVLLYITYANYLALGVNQVILKNYSKFKERTKIEEFLRINLQFLIVMCLVNIFLSYCLLDQKYALLAALVSIGNLLRSYFMSYFRVIDRTIVLNKNNLIFSALFLSGTFVFVSDVVDYLLVWTIASWFALILYFSDDFKFYLQIFARFFEKPDKAQFVYNVSEGIKLALTGFIATVFLTADRFIINKMDISLGLKGSYQLADFVGSAYYMVITTIIFYFYPKIIAKLRENAQFKKQYLSYISRAIRFSPLIILLVYLCSLGVEKWIFPEYKKLSYLITSSVALKTAIIFVTLFSTLYVSMDQEKKYIKSMVLPLVAIVLAGIYLVYFRTDFVLFVPLILCAILFIDALVKLIYFGKKNFSSGL